MILELMVPHSVVLVEQAIISVTWFVLHIHIQTQPEVTCISGFFKGTCMLSNGGTSSIIIRSEKAFETESASRQLALLHHFTY